MEQLIIKKRNGAEQPFDEFRIYRAIEKAFMSENLSDHDTVSALTRAVVREAKKLHATQNTLSVESVQDLVEEHLMRYGFHKVAKNYILYRSAHQRLREEKTLKKIKEHTLKVRINDTDTIAFNPSLIEENLRQLAPDLIKISITEMIESINRQVYDNITQKEINTLILSAARDRIELHYEYSALAGRIALNFLYRDLLADTFNSETLTSRYQSLFKNYIETGIRYELLHPDLEKFDIEALSKAIDPEKDKQFYFLGVQILQDRYLLRDRSSELKIFELPQWFWMRVAMGLALLEENKTERAIEFYTVLSNFDLISSTPTLFNSGTRHSQMSSCYLNVLDDSLEGIFKLYADNAQLSKWAGGIGTDWTNIRATGSRIQGTNGLSQGVIPFIKIFNDVALAVNQGGKRKGAMCAYMEMWHLDFEQFLELKKNTGDERRRAHDINTACWIPDLFMKRVQEDAEWTLFCPSQVPELHDLYGKEFEKKYVEYESKNLPQSKRISATLLWRKTLTMLYETGHPWITFKDPCNVRNPQDHVGVIHSSNLCTEITLNTSAEETAVCNLASINLARMIKDGQLDQEKIEKTIRVGIRMLDNVIDNNYYPTKEAEVANMKHRSVGLGMMGFQDALYQLDIPFESDACLDFADRSMEMVSYYAILASSKLAQERGCYDSYAGSKWSKGILPIDTIELLEEQRGQKIQINRNRTLDWSTLREHVKENGMRNSNTMAIAPTATISNIVGVYPCTEPAYKNIYMKENLSGNFIVMNRYLIDTLEKIGLWTSEIIQKIKLHNGSVFQVKEIPEHIREKFKETFEIDMMWLLKAAALRAKWIDQSASTNVFVVTQSGKRLSELYTAAWEMGLKTTYYLRSLGASQVTKTIEVEESSAQPEPAAETEHVTTDTVSTCSILDPDCEACQ